MIGSKYLVPCGIGQITINAKFTKIHNKIGANNLILSKVLSANPKKNRVMIPNKIPVKGMNPKCQSGYCPMSLEYSETLFKIEVLVMLASKSI